MNIPYSCPEIDEVLDFMHNVTLLIKEGNKESLDEAVC